LAVTSVWAASAQVCWPFRPELEAPLGVWSSSQLAECAAGRGCWRLCGDVAVLSCCTVYRISSSGHHGPDPFMLDQRTRSVLRAPCRTALDCNPNCNLTDPRLPADDSVTPWPSSPSLGLFPASWPRPGLAQAPPPNPIAAEPDGRRVLSRGGGADHAVTPQAPWTGSGCREYSYGGFGGGHPHFHPHDPPRQAMAHRGRAEGSCCSTADSDLGCPGWPVR
jgi:hypothetical protein